MTLTAKQERFVDEYLIDLNATQAAIRAGYSAKTAHVIGTENLGKPKIRDLVAKRQAERAERTQIDADWVFKRWAQLAQADHNELSSLVVGCCRHCHGTGFQYQWKDEEEFEEAQEYHFSLPDDQRVKRDPPVLGGGYGFNPRREPNPDCPKCDGYGTTRTVFRDTTKLSPEGQALYAGVKETQHGLEIKTHDQMKALEMMARHLGMFPNKVEHTGKNGGPIETISTEMTPAEAAEHYAATLDSDEG